MASRSHGGPGAGPSSSSSNGAPPRSSSSARGGRGRGKRGNGAVTASASRPTATSKQNDSNKVLPNLPLPLHNELMLREEYHDVYQDSRVDKHHLDQPKNALQVYMARRAYTAHYDCQEGYVGGGRQSSMRVTVIADEQRHIVGYGDAKTRKEAERLAALDALLQLARTGLLFEKPPSKKAGDGNKNGATTDARITAPKGATAKLSDGSLAGSDDGPAFIEYYCARFDFDEPKITYKSMDSKSSKKKVAGEWKAEMEIGGTVIGQGNGSSKKQAMKKLYLDAITYIESFDADLWKTFKTTQKPGGAAIGTAPHVALKVSSDVHTDIRNVYNETKQTLLFANRPRAADKGRKGEDGQADEVNANTDKRMQARPPTEGFLNKKSAKLLRDLGAYQIDESMAKMREQRDGLPVHQKASDVLVKIELNAITIVMAATGSGKTTQIPQIIFDDYILQEQGAKCNIVCTQPRRIAAISVAERVARERGEKVGQSVGYQVRFEAKMPQPHGSITFCTTGIFLRRLQSALGEEDASNTYLDSLTHIILDEVHERDLETDLLLVVLKRLLNERKRQGRKEIKLILMSATIDPEMFCNYFADSFTGIPAPVVEVAGRSYPVSRHFLGETYNSLDQLRIPPNEGGWVFSERSVLAYLDRELQQNGGMRGSAVSRRNEGSGDASDMVDDLELPYPLIALVIAFVISKSDDGHVLVFLPGWDEIKKVNQILEETQMRSMLGSNFMDSRRFEIHILHSSIPVEDQQAIFEPPRDKAIRRIILSTNIAETSVTIPDVVYVVDTGRVKEARYDPERHLSSLVSAWVGSSNVNQRAGRAGRHRAGEAYAIFSKERFQRLNVSSTVEMNRVDLSNVVMHIKALEIPGMDVEDVLDAAIEPPAPERVQAAVAKLKEVGALDLAGNLTSLGRVLLRLPLDAAVGKMCLYGAFFRCLDPCLTLAAVLTNRDPWIAPPHLREEVGTIRNSWTMPDFRSDTLVTLRAYTQWEDLNKRSKSQAYRFANDNFLGNITLAQIRQVKEHLCESMEKAGIFEAVLGSGKADNNGPGYRGPHHRSGDSRRRHNPLQPELNSNASSVPVLAALIAIASMPNFALRIKEHVYRTSQDKSCQIHSSSVQHAKYTKIDEGYAGEKELFAFAEKVKTGTASGGGGPTMLRHVTRLDPLTYMLFGANKLSATSDRGMLCDRWLPIKGDYHTLNDIERLKAILDVCMLRVFEAIESEAGYGESMTETSKRLQSREVNEFETLAAGVVKILAAFSREHREAMGTSRGSTRPATPASGPLNGGNAYDAPRSSGRGGGGGIGLLY